METFLNVVLALSVLAGIAYCGLMLYYLVVYGVCLVSGDAFAVCAG
jgi:hypothetical protein